MVELSEQIIEKLSCKGILAYVAVTIAGCGVYRTASLANAVRCTTAMMRDGMEELALHHPEVIQRRKAARKWVVGGAENPVQILELEDQRRIDFMDDLKRYWDYLNPNLPFSFGAKDGTAVGRFLRRNREWTKVEWRAALNHRRRSVINSSEPIYLWVDGLEKFAAGPLDAYGKPMGDVRRGKEASNRAAREAVVASAANRV